MLKRMMLSGLLAALSLSFSAHAGENSSQNCTDVGTAVQPPERDPAKETEKKNDLVDKTSTQAITKENSGHQ